MKSFTKKLFNIIALSLAFAPALRGDVQEHVTTLKKQIDTADAQTFKESCTALLNSEITVQDRKNALAMLERYAQKAKQQLQVVITSMGDETTSNRFLTEGIIATIFGAYFGIGAALCTPFTGFVSMDYFNNSIVAKVPTPLLSSFMAPYFGTGLGFLSLFGFEIGQDTPAVQRTAITLVTAGAIYSYFLLKYGIQHIKKSLNYKAYLEQQIVNLDEIIACIQQAIRELK